jgi:phosphocarrier protein
MEQQTVTVTNSLGIHARPASLIVEAAHKYNAEITLEKDNVSANAKSIMNVMMLAADQHSHVTIKAEGDNEKEAVQEIVRLFTEKFHEE